MTGTATVEKQGQDDDKLKELEPEKTIEDEHLEAAIEAADKEAKKAEVDDPAPAAAPGAVEDVPTETDPTKVGAVKEEAPKMVPVGVVTALRKENTELKHSNANLAGQVHMAEQIQGRQGGGQVIDSTPKPKTFDEQLGDLDTSLLAIAQKVDDGEISNEDAEKQRIEVRKQERAILADMNRPPEPAPAATTEPMQDLGLEEHMSGLVKEHPVLLELNQVQMEPLRTLAYEQAERDGNPITPGALGTKNLRERMAKFATQLYGTQDPAPSGDDPAPAADTTNKGLSEAEIAKRDKKLELAQTHPTDTSQLGSASDPQMVSDDEALARMENMSTEEQIAYLDKNPALMQRLEGAA